MGPEALGLGFGLGLQEASLDNTPGTFWCVTRQELNSGSAS